MKVIISPFLWGHGGLSTGEWWNSMEQRFIIAVRLISSDFKVYGSTSILSSSVETTTWEERECTTSKILLFKKIKPRIKHLKVNNNSKRLLSCET